MTFCHQCGFMTEQQEQWTTSTQVASDGGSQWIQVQGASSESYCGCKEGTFLWQGLCRSCLEGSRCPGSNDIEARLFF